MKKLLVVVDFQKDFVDGALGFDGAKNIEEVIEAKIKTYKEAQDDVVFTLDTHEEDYLETIEGQHLPIKHCIKGSKGWQIYGRINALSKNHPNLIKYTFGSDLLMKFIQEKPYKYDEIELVGLVSNICVISNAIIAKAASPFSHVFVDAKATDSYDKTIEEKSFDVLENLHIKVINRG